MLRYGSSLLLGLLLWPLLPARALALDLDDQIYSNRELGLRFAVPEGWVLSRQTGYPGLLAVVTHSHSNARMALAVASTRSRVGVDEVAASVRANLAAMRAVGLQLESATPRQPQPQAGWRVIARRDAADAAGPWELRQLYLPALVGRLLVLTLAAPKRQIKTFLLDRDALLASIEAGGAPLPAAVTGPLAGPLNRGTNTTGVAPGKD
ncbi:MAG: hypothetical protein IPL40_09115 [Proteobacteria bacterium]|nr:hypothetical protein [Pseudomonadota bacterium]